MNLHDALNLKPNDRVYASIDLVFDFGSIEEGTMLLVVKGLPSIDTYEEAQMVIAEGPYNGREVVFGAIGMQLILTEDEYHAKEKERAAHCDYCYGGSAISWKDNQNNAFVDKKGEMTVTAKDRTIRFKVKFCPMCGRRF